MISQSLIIPKLVPLLSSADKDIKKEAAWALANATSGGTPEQNKYPTKIIIFLASFSDYNFFVYKIFSVFIYLVDCGIIPPMCALLHETDAKVTLVALEALENVSFVLLIPSSLLPLHSLSLPFPQQTHVDNQ